MIKNKVKLTLVILCISFLISCQNEKLSNEEKVIININEYIVDKYENQMLVSKNQIEKYLIESGYTQDEATYAVNNCDVQWSHLTLRSALYYLNSNNGFSNKELINILSFENYTDEEIKYAINNCNANWNEQAVKSTKNYINRIYGLSPNSLKYTLKDYGYTDEQIQYALNQVEIDWNEQVVKCLNYYKLNVDEKGVINFLINSGYTEEEAVYGVKYAVY